MCVCVIVFGGWRKVREQIIEVKESGRVRRRGGGVNKREECVCVRERKREQRRMVQTTKQRPHAGEEEATTTTTTTTHHAYLCRANWCIVSGMRKEHTPLSSNVFMHGQ